MSKPLKPGDKVYFLSPKNRKLRGEVADNLSLKTRGEELEYPVIRPSKRKAKPKIDGHTKPLKVRWIKRSDLHKLPV